MERLFLVRILPHFKRYQSIYRRCQSTETALLRIFNDVYGASELKMATVLVALDLSAAFDTLDHSMLLRRLSESPVPHYYGYVIILIIVCSGR